MILRSGSLDANVFDRSAVKRFRNVWRPLDGAEDGAGQAAVHTYSIPTPADAAEEELAGLSASLAVTGAANALACSNVVPACLQAEVFLPEGSSEALLRAITDALGVSAAETGVFIGNFHGAVTAAVTRPVVTACVSGQQPIFPREETAERRNRPQGDEKGRDLLAVGTAGQSGTVILCAARQQELEKRFPMQFLEKSRRMKETLSVLPALCTMREEGIVPLRLKAAAEGGVYAALWDFADTGRGGWNGLTAELPAIPIRQETVELADACGIHPYQMSAQGFLLAAVEDGENAALRLRERGFAAARIGALQRGREKVLANAGEEQSLNRPEPDSLFRYLSR